MCRPQSPIQCIVPPHMLQHIAEKGTAEQRAWAIGTLYESEQFRGHRLAAQEFDALTMPTALGGGGLQRTIYSAQFGTKLPGASVRREGDAPTGDGAVDEAYEGAGDTYTLYQDIYQRDSIDNMGLPLISTVHYGQGYDNAFWNGKQMVYGDGDEDLAEPLRLFNRFTLALDIIGHELTHGVTQYTSQLVYRDQPGALNEAISDIFGILVKQHKLGQSVSESDWIIGKAIFTEHVQGVGIRSMIAPGTAYNDPIVGKDPQPAHMDDYMDVTYDNGGVHINSGIPNHAFYIMAKEMGGNAWERAGRIWYKAMTEKFHAKVDFQQAANITYLTAGELYGIGSLEQQSVKVGWKQVGINAEDAIEPTPPPANGEPVTEPQGCGAIFASFMKKR